MGWAPPPQRPSVGFLLVLLTAVAVRVVALLQARHAPFWTAPIVDEAAYLDLARSILAGKAPSHGAFYQTPGYGYFLAALLGLGASPAAVKVIQLACGVMSALLTWRIARTCFGPREAALAGLLWAVYPIALFHEVLLLKPALCVLLCLMAVSALVEPAAGSAAASTTRRRPVRRWAVGGLCLGLASLLQGELAGVAVLLLLGGALATRRGWPSAPGRRALGAYALASVLVLAVPTAQNLARGGGFVVVAYGGGTNFYIGNHTGADGSYLALRQDRSDATVEESDAVQLATAAEGRPLTSAEVSRHWWGRGLAWWRQQPLAALGLTLKKLALLWGPQEQADVLDSGLAARWMGVLRDPVARPRVLLPAALVGIWLSRRRRDLWALRAFVLGSGLMLVPFFVFERFRLPMTAAALPFAAYAGMELLDALRARRITAAVAVTAGAAALALLLGLVRVQRDPGVLRVNVGSMLLESGRYSEALAEFEAVRAANPSAWRVEINIATTLAMMHRTDAALRALDAVVVRLEDEARRTGRPPVEELVHCHALAGDLLLSSGRSEQAAQCYRAALALLPNHPQLLARLKQAEAAAGSAAPQGARPGAPAGAKPDAQPGP